MSGPEEGNGKVDERVTRQHWRWTILAGMASYLDAGSIVALGSGLALWQQHLHLSSSAVGALAAIGPNAIGAAIGSFIGGRLGDLFGRKRIYQYDLLVYALGILLIIISANAPLLFIGTVLIGVAVGADVPTSLALVGEFAPSKARGRLMGLTQVAWSVGPIVVLVLAFIFAPFGLTGTRIVFGQLFVIALVTWYLRRGLVESARWTAASGAGETRRTSAASEQPELAPIPQHVRSHLRGLLSRTNLGALAYTGIFYTFWNLAAGTNGIFFPYIVRTLGAQSQAASVGLQAVGFVLTAISVAFIFMPFNDRSDRARRVIFGTGAIMSVAAFLAWVIFPLNTPTVIANIVLFGLGGTIAGEAFYKTWSQELFPTLLRGTAQGITFGVARVVLGIWSFFLPTIAATGIKPAALLLTVFLFISGVVGFFFMPKTAGKSLEEIEAERGGKAADVNPAAGRTRG
ncbi:MFS transporter [Rubrobacter calidifluminis]|uniref:MFS transporter n=1 Tax=Rubrobacter calidifluminis TaxID=1392640 RepID=UPI003B59C81A